MNLSINGAELHCNSAGDEHAPALLALHGGPGIADHRNELKALGPLADAYRVVAYDQRGCGRASATPPFSNAQYVADAEGVRTALGLGRMALYGGSYGGFIALLYALEHPERLTHLILRDTAPSNRFVGQAKANALSQLDRAPGLTEAMLDRMFAGTVESNADFKAIFERIAPLYWAGEPPEGGDEPRFRFETHNAMFSNEFARYDLTERLGEIRVPTLIAVGRHDWITPPEAAELLAERIPNARLVVFERSGHSPQLEENVAFVDAVRAFLDEF